MADNKNRWLKLAHLACIRASGADAVAFLQGQLSNDVRRVTETRAQISSYNSPKGRMLAVLHLLRQGDDLILELHRSIAEAVQKRLRLYVLRSKVSLQETGSALGLLGDDAAAILEKLELPCPAQPLEVRAHSGIQVLRRLGPLPRFSLYAEPAKLDELAARLAALAAEGSETDWRRADIEGGIPSIYPQTQDHFVPQWCNLDQLGGISLDKGCYTGQEIVARIHYLGEVKRRMKTVHLTDCAGLIAGAQTEHGEIVDAVPVPEGGCLGLSVQKA